MPSALAEAYLLQLAARMSDEVITMPDTVTVNLNGATFEVKVLAWKFDLAEVVDE